MFLGVKRLRRETRRISCFLFFVFVFFISCTKPKKLPYFGEREVDRGDTIYHEIQPFYFTNQDGVGVTEQSYRDTVYIADFFFTTCPGICPIMTSELSRVQKYILDHQLPVKILSHTVDPETDQLEVLKAYANKNGANFKVWNFVRGSKSAIYLQALSYLVVAEEDTTAEIPFVHSDKLILIDKKGHIRGMYSGIDPEEVDVLLEDMEILLKDNE